MSDKKAVVLGLIKEKRHILFGKCSETVTHQLKTDTWLRIYERGCSMGILDPSKGWRYLRDTVWQNWKKVSLGKANNKKNSRTMNKRSRLNEIDKTVLEILSSESYVTKSTFNKSNQQKKALLRKIKTKIPLKEKQEKQAEAPSEIESNSHNTCETVTSPIITNIVTQDCKQLTKQDIEIKILKTNLELLKRDVYMKDIQIYKNEKEFGLPISEFTRKFYNVYSNSSEVGSNLYSNSPDIEYKEETD